MHLPYLGSPLNLTKLPSNFRTMLGSSNREGLRYFPTTSMYVITDHSTPTLKTGRRTDRRHHSNTAKAQCHTIYMVGSLADVTDSRLYCMACEQENVIRVWSRQILTDDRGLTDMGRDKKRCWGAMLRGATLIDEL